MSEELKACICGTPAHIHEISMGDNWRTRYQIWCHDKACGFEGGIYNSTKKCVEEWNTRPIEDALRAELAEAQAEVERWIPVSEKMPEMGKVVLLNIKGAKRAKEGYLTPRNEWRVWGGTYPDLSAVTHWMPMPKGPIKKEKS